MTILLFVTLLVMVRGDGMPANCSDASAEECIFRYYDANQDGIITAAEIDAFNITAVCNQTYWPLGDIINSSYIFPACDIGENGYPELADGVITTFDFQGPFSCLRAMAMCSMICMQCNQCDAYALSLIPTTAPTPAPTEPPTEAPTEAPTVDPFAWMTTDPPTEAPTL
jgi:hypothetical protein